MTGPDALRLPVAALTLLLPAGVPAATKPPPFTHADYSLSVQWDGQTVADPYRWLGNDGSPETQDWETSQSGYTRDVLAAVPGGDAWPRRLTPIRDLPWQSPPLWVGGRGWIERRDHPGATTYLAILDGPNALPRAAFPPPDAGTPPPVAPATWSPSPDGRLLVYSTPEAADGDAVLLAVRDLSSGADLPARIRATPHPRPCWTADSSGFIYATSTGPGTTAVRFHALSRGTPREPILWQGPLLPGETVETALSSDGRFLLVTAGPSAPGAPREASLVDLGDGPSPEFRRPPLPLAGRGEAQFRWVGNDGPRVHLLTDAGGDGLRVVSFNIGRPDRSQWSASLRPGNVPSSITFSSGRFAWVEASADGDRVLLATDRGDPLPAPPLPRLGRIDRWTPDPAAGATSIAFTSWVHPAWTFRIGISSRTLAAPFAPRVDFAPDAFTVHDESHGATAAARRTLRVLVRKDRGRNGDLPVLLLTVRPEGLVPGFDPSVIAWVESGGAVALAETRATTPDDAVADLLASARALADRKWSRSDRVALIARGPAALVAAAALQQDPGFAGCLVLDGADLDPAGSLANPARVPSLAPLHLVRSGSSYPATLVLRPPGSGSLGATRKFVATLQAAQAGKAPILLGPPSSDAEVDLEGLLLAFAARSLGHAPPRAWAASAAPPPAPAPP